MQKVRAMKEPRQAAMRRARWKEVMAAHEWRCDDLS